MFKFAHFNEQQQRVFRIGNSALRSSGLLFSPIVVNCFAGESHKERRLKHVGLWTDDIWQKFGCKKANQ
jgi:hypothetical protein